MLLSKIKGDSERKKKTKSEIKVSGVDLLEAVHIARFIFTLYSVCSHGLIYKVKMCSL